MTKELVDSLIQKHKDGNAIKQIASVEQEEKNARQLKLLAYKRHSFQVIKVYNILSYFRTNSCLVLADCSRGYACAAYTTYGLDVKHSTQHKVLVCREYWLPVRFHGPKQANEVQ